MYRYYVCLVCACAGSRARRGTRAVDAAYDRLLHAAARAAALRCEDGTAPTCCCTCTLDYWASAQEYSHEHGRLHTGCLHDREDETRTLAVVPCVRPIVGYGQRVTQGRVSQEEGSAASKTCDQEGSARRRECSAGCGDRAATEHDPRLTNRLHGGSSGSGSGNTR
jgi:hypothetical protein